MAQSIPVTLETVTNHQQTYGTQDYVIFDAFTKENQPVSVGISHNALRRLNVEIGLADSLKGSTVIIKDSTDIKTGLIVTAEEKVNRVVNEEINPKTGRPYSLILCSSTLDFSLLKSELYVAESKDIISATNAKVVIEKDKERKLLAIKRATERLRGYATAKTEEKTVEKTEASLDTNDEESPF